MPRRYEETAAPRFKLLSVDGREETVIPAQRSLFITLFVSIWLCAWTFGGAMAMKIMISHGFQPFLLIWLCGWALGEIYPVATLGWQFNGAEVLRVSGSDLETEFRVLGFARRELYRGSELRELSAGPSPILPYPLSGGYYQSPLPFFFGNKTGCVKFAYGARTVYLAAGLDEVERLLIVEHLRKRLRASATG